MSSFNGRIDDIPKISVDNFEDRRKKAYFLSHCHTDHTVGLYDDNFLDNIEETGAKIYMTELSMKIVKYTTKNSGVCAHIQPLPLGTTTVTVDDGLHIEVTLIPAGHCLGSVMFLFRTNGKTVLYTGDFRIRTNDISKYAQFHRNGEPITIDVMYVDTTFIRLCHQEFSKRSDSVDEMVHKIDTWLKEAPENRVAIHTSGNYVSEFSFREIYKQLNLKVCVDDRIWELYRQIPELLPAVTHGVSDPEIHLCRNIRYKHLCDHNRHRTNRYLSLHLSATKWTDYDTEETTLRPGYYGTIDVCFATHCSRNELVSFVNYFSPATVVGFPNAYNPDTPQKVFEDDFVPSPVKQKELNIECRRGKKVSKNLLEEMFR